PLSGGALGHCAALFHDGGEPAQQREHRRDGDRGTLARGGHRGRMAGASSRVAVGGGARVLVPAHHHGADWTGRQGAGSRRRTEIRVPVTSTNRHARARRPSRSERRFVSVLATVILMASFACGDPYRHTNPYDPAVPVTITVLGPDSLFSYTEQAHFTAQIVPAFPDTAVQFSSSDNGQFQLVGAGTFEAGPRVGPPLWPATSTVTVTAGIGAFDTLRSDAGLAGPAPMDTAWRHIGSKTVVITQRVVGMLVRCPDTHIS